MSYLSVLLILMVIYPIRGYVYRNHYWSQVSPVHYRAQPDIYVSCRPDGCCDRNTNCKVWADAGYCNGYYHSWMVQSCEFSCDMCLPLDVKTTIEQSQTTTTSPDAMTRTTEEQLETTTPTPAKIEYLGQTIINEGGNSQPTNQTYPPGISDDLLSALKKEGIQWPISLVQYFYLRND